MKKSFLTFLLVFSACLVFAAKKKMPDWIILPSSVYPSETYMNGTGSGKDRETAELEAVRNLSSVFGQTIKSASVASKKMEQALSDGKVSFSSSGNLQQNITSQIESENLIGIEIAEYFYSSSEKKWYAIAVLDREKTAAVYQELIKKNDVVVRQSVREAEKNPGSFYGYSEVTFALDIASENDRLLKNLSVIDSDKGIAVGKEIVSVQSVQNSQKKFAGNIVIYVNVNGDSDNKIKSAFQSVFAKYGFKTSPLKKEKYGLDGKYSSEISKIGKITYCVYTLDLDFSDQQESESLFAINLKGREGAPSELDAKNRTYRVLERNIEAEFSKNFDSYMNGLAFK